MELRLASATAFGVLSSEGATGAAQTAQSVLTLTERANTAH